MLKPAEELLQLIWQYRLLKPLPLVTRSGHEITVLNPGQLNNNAGPDFSNSSIRIHGVILNGNIEVHVTTSDWLKHNHQQNAAYDQLILHVVFEHDLDLPQNESNNVEVLELKGLIDESTLHTYERMKTSHACIPCESQLEDVSDLKFILWLERMSVERLEAKTLRIKELFKSYNGDYSQTFYTLLLRSFGFHVNSGPFELLARHLPLKILLRHSDDLLQLEALLLGMAGLLDEQPADSYLLQLQNEFAHLRHKYQLIALKKELFKFSRMRPANFPTLRLAQLAAFIHQHPQVFQQTDTYTDPIALKKLLRVTPSGYWARHYTPGGRISETDLALGKTAAELLVINTFAPFLFFCSKQLLKPELSETALELFASCGFEHNVKTRSFSAKQTILKDAADSQGLIHLYDAYCTKKQCLKCGVAASLLKSSRLLIGV